MKTNYLEYIKEENWSKIPNDRHTHQLNETYIRNYFLNIDKEGAEYWLKTWSIDKTFNRKIIWLYKPYFLKFGGGIRGSSIAIIDKLKCNALLFKQLK